MTDWREKPEIDTAAVQALIGAVGEAVFRDMRVQFVADLRRLVDTYWASLDRGETADARDGGERPFLPPAESVGAAGHQGAPLYFPLLSLRAPIGPYGACPWPPHSHVLSSLEGSKPPTLDFLIMQQFTFVSPKTVFF